MEEIRRIYVYYNNVHIKLLHFITDLQQVQKIFLPVSMRLMNCPKFWQKQHMSKIYIFIVTTQYIVVIIVL